LTLKIINNTTNYNIYPDRHRRRERRHADAPKPGEPVDAGLLPGLF